MTWFSADWVFQRLCSQNFRQGTGTGERDALEVSGGWFGDTSGTSRPDPMHINWIACDKRNTEHLREKRDLSKRRLQPKGGGVTPRFFIFIRFYGWCNKPVLLFFCFCMKFLEYAPPPKQGFSWPCRTRQPWKTNENKQKTRWFLRQTRKSRIKRPMAEHTWAQGDWPFWESAFSGILRFRVPARTHLKMSHNRKRTFSGRSISRVSGVLCFQVRFFVFPRGPLYRNIARYGATKLSSKSPFLRSDVNTGRCNSITSWDWITRALAVPLQLCLQKHR